MVSEDRVACVNTVSIRLDQKLISPWDGLDQFSGSIKARYRGKRTVSKDKYRSGRLFAKSFSLNEHWINERNSKENCSVLRLTLF